MADLQRIQFKRTSTAGRKPDANILTPGELAINLADRELYTKDDSNNVITLGHFRGELPSDANLDNYGPTGKFTGVWSKSTSTNAQPANKFPEENAVGVLEVFVAGQFAGTQRYTTRMGMVYTRCLAAAWDASAPKWEEWKQVGHGTPATFYDGDLNDFKTPGLYNILGTDAVINCPTGEGLPTVIVGLLEVKQRASGGAIFQKFTTAGTGATTRDRIFERAYTGSAWGAWNEVYTSYSMPITLGMGGVKAKLAELDWNTFDFVPGSMFSVPLEKIKNMPANMDWGTIDGNLILFSVGPSEHTSTGRTVQVWRGTVSQANYRYFVVRVAGNPGNRSYKVRRVVLEDGRHTWTAQQDFNGGVNFGAATTFKSTTTFNTEVKFRKSNAFRMTASSNYDVIWRADSSSFYLLSTDENDKDGNFNTNRPFSYEFSTGDVSLGGTSRGRVLKLKRDSLTAFFGGDINMKGLMIFDAGRLGSRDYFKFNHWGDSNNARDNIIQLEDSQGAHFSTERTLATGAIKTKFFGDLESAGQIRWGKGTATSTFNIRVWGADARKQVFECADESGWHWYTQRPGGPGTSAIEFAINGTVKPQAIHTGGNIIINGADIEFKRAGNKHIWFRDPNGLELGLMYCDDAGVIRFRGQKQAQTWKLADKMIHLESGSVGGSDKGLIRGNVSGGSWASWRDRASGLQVDCPQSTDSAHNIWKATHWGKYHIAAMGVHVPSGTIGNATVKLHVNDAGFDFNASGDMTAGRNGSFNDVYIRSDARLKINKEEYKDNATDKVNRLTVYTYDKVKSLTDRTVIAHEVGIIAQDLEKELPEAVTTSKVGDPDKPEEILTISNSAVNALLIKAFQEMSEEIKELKTPFFTKIARKIGKYFKF